MVTEQQIADFAKACEEMRADYFRQMGYKVDAFNPHVGYTIGERYARLTVPNGGGLSAFCFVDMETGDILNPATWAAPAKGARGNIANGAADLTPHGAKYLR